MAQKPLPSLAAPLLCHFCFQHFAAQFSEHQKAAYTRYVLCAAISIPFFAHILPSRIFFSILYFFPLQILHECAKEVRLRTFFALPNLCVCFLPTLWHGKTPNSSLLTPKAIPHNSKCRYGERGAAVAKPKAQIILDVLSSILATQMPCRSRRSGA